VVAALGSYNPHAKTANIDKEKVSFYLEHGAQPSERVARLLKAEGVKLPKWVKVADEKKRTIKNTEKLRKNRPQEAEPAEAPVEKKPAEEPAPEAETPTEAAPAETPAEETPAGDTKEKKED
jgi:small subunit ribosomal protein S16